MDDGVSPMPIGILCLLLFLVQVLLQTFISALHNISEKNADDIQESDRRDKDLLLKYRDDEKHHELTVLCYSLICFGGICLGAEKLLSGCLFSFPWQKIAAETGLFVFILLAFLLLGICIPIQMAEKDPVSKAFSLLHIYRIFYVILFPLVAGFRGFSQWMIRLFHGKPNASDEDVIEEEIISMVNEGHEQGVILASEAAMIQNIFAFGDKDAKDIMIHRKNITAMDGEMTLREAIQFINHNNFSRLPVYLHDMDNIIGIIHIKDVLSYVEHFDLYDIRICDMDHLVHSVEFVPETHGINTLFTKMKHQKSHMVMVVDEYGQTSGLITMEDIIEEILGSIQDEHDDETESVEKVTEGQFLMEGRTQLDEVEKLLGISFGEEDIETLNGLLIAHYHKIPSDHETFCITLSGYEFHVLDVENKMIQSVQVKKVETAE